MLRSSSPFACLSHSRSMTETSLTTASEDRSCCDTKIRKIKARSNRSALGLLSVIIRSRIPGRRNPSSLWKGASLIRCASARLRSCCFRTR